MLGDPTKLLNKLLEFKDRIRKVKQSEITRVQKILEENSITEDVAKKASRSAWGLFMWINYTIKLYYVIKDVMPLEKKLEEATEKLNNLRKDL